MRGMLHSLYLDTPYEFVNLVQMIDKMEEVFDTKGFPEAFMTPKMFKASNGNRINKEVDGNVSMKDNNNSTIQTESGGSKCTFEINVRFRQNASWQGQILWVEKNLKQNFRSVLEMLKLMDEALSDEARENSVKWERI